MTKISPAATKEFTALYREPHAPLAAGEDVSIVRKNMLLQDVSEHQPTTNEAAINKDAKQIARIYMDNQARAFPKQADLINETIDFDRLVGFFEKQITSNAQSVIAVKGLDTGNVYGFMWMGAPIQKELKDIIGEDASVLHGLYVDKNYHGERIAHMLWKDFIDNNSYGRTSPKVTTLYTVVSKANKASKKAFRNIGAKKHKDETSGKAYDYKVKTFSGEHDPSHIMKWDSFDLIQKAVSSAFGHSRPEQLSEATGGDALPYMPPPEQYRD